MRMKFDDPRSYAEYWLHQEFVDDDFVGRDVAGESGVVGICAEQPSA